MQTVAEWKASRNAPKSGGASFYDQTSAPETGGVQSVSQWKKQKLLSTGQLSLQPVPSIEDAKRAIAGIESSGGNYSAIGPKTEKGNQAYGKYQVMDFNIPSWTKEALGKSLTTQEFLADKNAQEKVFEKKFQEYATKYGGYENAAKVWFGGAGALSNPNAKDILGTTVDQYAKMFSGSIGDVPKPANTGFNYGPATPFIQGAGEAYVSSVKETARSSFGSAVEAADTIGAGGTPFEGLEAGIKLETGIAGVLFSPFVPVMDLLSKAIDFAGEKLAETPLMKEYAKTATETDIRVLTALQGLGTIAMGILGAKGGKAKPTDVALERLKNEPAIVEAVQKFVEAKESAKAMTPGVKSVAEWKAAGKPAKVVEAPRSSQPAFTDQQAREYVQNNFDNLFAAYEARAKETYRGADNVISADVAKEVIPGYTGPLAGIYHEASSSFAKTVYAKWLDEKAGTGNGEVLFTSGATGVGKSSALKALGTNLKDYSIVYDGNLSGDSALVKIQQAIDAGYRVVIYTTHRDPLKAFVEGVTPRIRKEGRIVTIDEHVSRHAEVLPTNAKIEAKFAKEIADGSVEVRHVDNTGGRGTARFSQLDKLPKFDYTNLHERLNSELQRAHSKGLVTSEEVNAIKSRQSGSEVPRRAQPASDAGKVKTPEAGKLQSRVFERLKAENPSLEGDLGYDPIKLKEDAAKAVALIEKDKQKAFDIAMGKETSSEVTSTAVNIAMAEKALAEGNTALYTRLIKNRSLEQTRRGQELVAEKASITDNSISRYVKELIAIRLEKLGDTYLADVKDIAKKSSAKQKGTSRIDKDVEDFKTKIKAKKLTMTDARSLLDALTCV